MEVLHSLALVTSSVTFLGLSILFGDSLLLRFDFKTFLKAGGFLILAIFPLVNLFYPLPLSVFMKFEIFAFFLIFIAFVLDPYSKFKLLSPIPVILIFFLTNHSLLFILAALISISVFQLIYTTKHNDLIPLGLGFALISVGEYLYSLEGFASLQSLSSAGSFPYLFASLVMITWLWSYLATRFFDLIKSN